MKKQNKFHYLMMALIVTVVAAATWSCDKDEDPTLTDLREDKIAYLTDSLRISDSLKRINAAGVVNYAITVVSGSTSSLFKNDEFDIDRVAATKSVISGATVSISQFGKTETDTTDASGMVVFNGYFRTAVNVTVQKDGFTSVSYISVVNKSDVTENNGIYFVGNIIPVFELTGPNTATISGKVTIQTDLTNKTRELVPDGTVITAMIDATDDSDFSDKFLTNDVETYGETETSELFYLGSIIDASYATNIIGTVTGGNYTITVPAAVDGLPIKLEYSDIAADQTLFEFTGNGDPFNQAVTYRTIFEGSDYTPSSINAAGNVSISFTTGSGGAANAVISLPETIDRINITNGGSGYTGTPLVTITGGGGTGAKATAVVTDGVVKEIILDDAGTGYTSAPTVSLISGSGALATSTLAADGTVTGVALTNTGSGYTTAPTVTFSAPGGTGTTATGTATIDGAGRVTGVTITDAGSQYTGNPTVTFSAAPAGGITATGNGIYSGRSVASVSIGSSGFGYTYAPSVTFSAPERANGVTAKGTAQIDASTGQVTGIMITVAGSGYTAQPSVTLDAGSGAAAQALLTGGTVLSANITAQGSGYESAPIVQFSGGNGTGAQGTAVVADGKLIGINITNAGAGYTIAPAITLITGSGAQAYASIDEGGVSAVTIVNGGSNYTGAPKVTFTSAIGGGATGTATVAGGQVTGVTVDTPGTGYIEGNIPSGAGNAFEATKGSSFETKTGVQYINDIYYGTGVRQPN